MEVDLSAAWKQGKLALKVGSIGAAVPFLLGFVAAWYLPGFLGRSPEADPTIFALFLATALAISALPVIAKTLIDLDLYRTDFGMTVVSAAVFNDLVGWTVFAMTLGMMDRAVGAHASIAATVLATFFFAVAMLTVGRSGIHRLLPYVQAYTHWPGGVLSFAMVLALLGAALTEWIGVHAIFGSFLVGVAIGDSPHLREKTRVVIDQFISFIFAPVFFASIGLKVDFLSHFNGLLVCTIFLIACIGKLAGAVVGARWGGMEGRDAWAVGFAMNARGAMEIILGLLALQAGLIQQQLFVALVVMAIGTSMLSGPMMQRLLGLKKRRQLANFLSPKLYIRGLQAVTRREAVEELVTLIADVAKLDRLAVLQSVWAREEIVSTGIGHGVALPHARIPKLPKPLVAIGLSEAGVDFDSPDGAPAHAIFLILTPFESPGIQLEIAAEISKLFRDPHLLEQALRSHSYTELLAILKAAGK
jgi:Kef-type K+ transport system membrane component KefB/mannitol/fructose-specific phosphotransferase system IIA component (Ntr-type)